VPELVPSTVKVVTGESRLKTTAVDCAAAEPAKRATTVEERILRMKLRRKVTLIEQDTSAMLI
jgi:hypothetical protein